MPDESQSVGQIPTFCALCISRCGAIATVEDGRLDPARGRSIASHRPGALHQGQGRASARLPSRSAVLSDEADPPEGCCRSRCKKIPWDEALDTIAARLGALAKAHGPETVALRNASPSTSALDNSVGWLRRLRRAFGSPNQSTSMELCGWGRWLANLYSYGTALPAGVMPNMENAAASCSGVTTLRFLAGDMEGLCLHHGEGNTFADVPTGTGGGNAEGLARCRGADDRAL